MTQIARWTALIALFTVPFLPLYVANELFFPFITGKAFAFRILVEAALCGWLVLAALDAKYRPRFSWTLAAFGAFTAWMLVADLLAVNPEKALWSNFERMDGWVTLIHLFAFFLVASSLLSVDKLWRKWWFTFLGVASLVCVYGLFQLAGMAEIHQGGVRVDSSLGNAIYLAVYLLFAFAITVWQAIETKGGWRYALAVLAALELLVLFSTATRGAFLGLVAGIGIAALLWLATSGKKNRKAAGGVLIALALLAGGFFLVRDSAFVRSDPTLARIASISLAEGSTRFTLWSMALEGVKERPLTGWGQEGFNYVFNAHYRPSLYEQESWFDRAHNVFIDWLVAGGIPAFILFILFLAIPAIALWRSRLPLAERVLLCSAIAAYAIQALFVFDNLFASIPLVMILAMAHAASARPIKKLDGLPALRSETGQGIALAGGLALALILVFTVNVPNLRAGNALIYAISPIPGGVDARLAYFKKALAADSFAGQEIREQLVSYASTLKVGTDGTTSAQKAAAYELAIAEMDKQLAKTPDDARLWLEYANLYDAAGDAANGLEKSEKALALSPKKQSILLKRGIEYWQTGDAESAQESFRAAYELDPSFTAIAPYAAVGDIITGDPAAANALLLEAFGTTTIDNEALLMAYYQAKRFDEVLAIAELRVRSSGGTPESRFRLAQFYAAVGRFADARAEIAKAVSQHPESAAEAASLSAELFRPR